MLEQVQRVLEWGTGLGGVGGNGAEGGEGGVPATSAGLGAGDGACASTLGAKGLRVTLNFGAPPVLRAHPLWE